MGLRLPELGSEQVVADERDDEKRRLSVFHLVGLATGGVVGSGWLMSAEKASEAAGPHAWLSWLLGGLAVLLIAVVMVELGIAAPKTGGLIFLPWRSSGALVATVVAAGLWLFYAINLASEATAMTKGLSWKVGKLFRLPENTDLGTLTPRGWGIAVVFMLMISAVSLAAPWLFFHINSWLTVVKVVIPVLAVVSLAAVGPATVVGNKAGTGHSFAGTLYAVVSAGVLYSYMGFQGPLDFAGNIRRRGIGEAARLRWAVFGTILGSMALYLALQFVYDRYPVKDGKASNPEASPFFRIADAAHLGWLGGLLWVGAMLAPMGAGLVFAHALTREVAELSRAHLTHRGLQTARKATFLKGRYDGYWLVLVVDFLVALIILGFAKGSWDALASLTGILALIVYAFPGVVLVSLRDRLKGYGYSPLRLKVQEWLARASFVLIALLLYGAGWPHLWRGMRTLAVGCIVLLLLPLLPRWRPGFRRIYDAKEHVTLFAQWRTRPAVWAAITLIGYLAALTLLTLLGNPSPNKPLNGNFLLVGSLVAVMAVLVFEGLVRISRRHMAEEPPNLPTPAPPAPPAPAASGAKG